MWETLEGRVHEDTCLSKPWRYRIALHGPCDLLAYSSLHHPKAEFSYSPNSNLMLTDNFKPTHLLNTEAEKECTNLLARLFTFSMHTDTIFIPFLITANHDRPQTIFQHLFREKSRYAFLIFINLLEYSRLKSTKILMFYAPQFTF